MYHHPKKLNKSIPYEKERVYEAWGAAQYNLALLEGSQRKLENPNLLISPLTTKEATVSSKIEGTQSTVTDVFAFSAGAETSSGDAQEVSNYRKTMNYAIEQLNNNRSIGKSLLREMHAMLLDKVRRNVDSRTGVFRDKDVWIGAEGTPIEEAKYVPPEHFLVNDYVEDLLRYIQTKEEKALIKAGVVHYQFEAVHPFDDGNGRIGRLLIPLLLFAEQKMTLPILYVSGYFERYRDEYVEALRTVDKTGDYTEWLVFFMVAVKEQLAETQQLVDSIYELNTETRKRFAGSQYRYVLDFVDFIFRSPVFTANDVISEIDMSVITAKNLIKEFITHGLLVETDFKKKRSKVYAFQPLLNLLN